MTPEQLIRAEEIARKAMLKMLLAEHRSRELMRLSAVLARFDIDLLVHSHKLLEQSRNRLARQSSM